MLEDTALCWPHLKDVREVANSFIPTFGYKYDDYLQYTPAATIVALNALNIKRKHSSKSAFVSYAFSMRIMGPLTTEIKYTAKTVRPDTNSKDFFPSGHTAMALVNAAALDKEFGQYRNPLIDLVGYNVATNTPLSRGLNNRYWVTEAAIGLVSTELGYQLADQIFKDRGMNAPIKSKPVSVSNNPSFVELHLGYTTPTSKDLKPVNSDEVYATDGFNFGLEGAWFINKNFGVGGEYAFSSFPLNSRRVPLDPESSRRSTELYIQALVIKYFNIGAYFSLPLPNNWFITGKINAGVSSGSKGNFILRLKEKYQKDYPVVELPYMKYKPKTASSYSMGVGIQKRIGRNTAIKAYATYFGSTHEFEMELLNYVTKGGQYTYQAIKNEGRKADFDHFAFGIGLTAFIW
ncbi:outer membrane beta-barrel protein [Pedobacter sp. KBW06]|uniref:outer membrane beta-barrel protein n=1 Tax=Pedobacter sp. KBW06 TaxID=2153359 RepID=UPI0013153A6E|nr:outer membrane beta-barrel protein [Pedobacter sp. KBW06]